MAEVKYFMSAQLYYKDSSGSKSFSNVIGTAPEDTTSVEMFKEMKQKLYDSLKGNNVGAIEEMQIIAFNRI